MSTEELEFHPELLERCINFAIQSHNAGVSNYGPPPKELDIAWGQGSWSGTWDHPEDVDLHECRSTFCIAGAAWYFMGLVEKYVREYETTFCTTHSLYSGEWDHPGTADDCNYKTHRVYDHKLVNIDKVFSPDHPQFGGLTETNSARAWRDGALVLFGITQQEGDKLFRGSNVIHDVVRISREIADRRRVTLKLDTIRR
jgi:hypothetical protein